MNDIHAEGSPISEQVPGNMPVWGTGKNCSVGIVLPNCSHSVCFKVLMHYNKRQKYEANVIYHQKWKRKCSVFGIKARL